MAGAAGVLAVALAGGRVRGQDVQGVLTTSIVVETTSRVTGAGAAASIVEGFEGAGPGLGIGLGGTTKIGGRARLKERGQSIVGSLDSSVGERSATTTLDQVEACNHPLDGGMRVDRAWMAGNLLAVGEALTLGDDRVEARNARIGTEGLNVTPLPGWRVGNKCSVPSLSVPDTLRANGLSNRIARRASFDQAEPQVGLVVAKTNVTVLLGHKEGAYIVSITARDESMNPSW